MVVMSDDASGGPGKGGGRDKGFDPLGAGMGDFSSDAPLFRELQRVLQSSQGGPINWELARQVGVAAAQEGREDPAPSEDDARALEEAVRLAELQIEQHTGLEPPPDVAVVRAVRRAEWVQTSAESLRSLLEPAAERIGGAMSRTQEGVELPEEMAGVAPQLQAAMGQLSPLLLGMQVGQVLGFLGQRVLGQYDVAVPRQGAAQLLFVTPNLAAFERDWSLPAAEFRTWVALHEVTHRFEFARPWVGDHFRSLVDDYLSTIEFDVSGLQEALGSFDPSNPGAMDESFAQQDAMVGPVLDDEQRLKLGRIQAFMAAAEGYADHVMHTVGTALLPAASRMEEAMRRYRESEDGDLVFERLLGVDMKREQYRQGRAFCDTVVSLTDEATLARIWDAADTIPSLPEIEEPRLWLARIV